MKGTRIITTDFRGNSLVFSRSPQQPRHVRIALPIRAAKRVKGPKTAAPAPSKQGGGGKLQDYKSAGKVREGSAYQEETRKTILALRKVTKVAPTGKEILKNIDLGMYLGAKIGFLGANGAGKSTLMRIIAGVDDKYDGHVTLVDGIKVGYLEQEPQLRDGDTVDENIRPALARMQAMLQEYEEVSSKMATGEGEVEALMARMDTLQAEIDAGNGWELERMMQRAAEALRCPPGDASVANLSGGEARRVALCRILLEAPDVLLLDEPTNHLDCASVAWLERTLADFKGTVIAVTHDRFFLDNVAGWILELDRGQGIPFQGNYSEWLEAKEKRLAAEKREQAGLQRALKEELEWVRSKAKGQMKKGKARMRQYDELTTKAAEYTRTSTLDSITIPVGPRLGKTVLVANGLTKGYGDRVLMDNVNFDVPPGAIVGIVGGNGAGKSTLFRMIMGEETPDAGELVVGETVAPMYSTQSREGLDSTKTLFEEVGEGAEEIQLGVAGKSIPIRAYCSLFNFKGADQQKKVGMLSGGERNRLQLAKVLKKSGNLLLLDEPTNDMDVDTLRSLEEAIANFAGTVLCISHDRWFLDRLATHILAFEDEGKVVWFEGGYSEYEADLRARTGNADPSRVKYRKMALA